MQRVINSIILNKKTEMELMQKIWSSARERNRCIVLPEGTEERTLQAANKITEENLARIVLIGNKAEIEQKSVSLNLNHIKDVEIIDPKNNPKKQVYADLLYELRKERGMTKEQAEELAENPLYLANLMIKNKDAHGAVAGAENATGDVLRPAFQIIRTRPGVSVVSGAFIMVFKDKQWGEDGVMVFADCAAHPNPNAEELAGIAVATAHTAKSIAGIEPKVALLSFSTKGSAKHEMVDKIVEATKLAQEMAPEFDIDGELQADAAIVPSIGSSKAPDSKIAGKANVLVFPTLETGNIAYKLVQRMAGAEAIGPIMQGMAAPINDLSRGCSVEDIVNLVAITANQD